MPVQTNHVLGIQPFEINDLFANVRESIILSPQSPPTSTSTIPTEDQIHQAYRTLERYGKEHTRNMASSNSPSESSPNPYVVPLNPEVTQYIQSLVNKLKENFNPPTDREFKVEIFDAKMIHAS